MLDIEDQFGEQLRKLFQNPKYQSLSVLERGFAFPQHIHQNSLLFIGLNPSISKEAVATAESHFYPVSHEMTHPYFAKFNKFTETTGSTWAHLDLLGIRETNQKAVEQLIKDSTGCSFIWEHLQLTRMILEQTAPKVIIVANTLSRRFLGKERSGDDQVWLGYEFKFDDDLGTHLIINKDSALCNVPVFFTSMLTGQRALDNGSFERLVWHVRKAIGNE